MATSPKEVCQLHLPQINNKNLQMKELDLLKKDWQKDNAFEQVSEVEIYTMIHKKSSSIVKWILIVSIIEFIVLNGISFLLPDTNSEDMYEINYYLDITQIASYGVTLFFMYLFYKNYRLISATSTIKKLMENIIKTRKAVNYYILYNISYIIIVILFVILYLMVYDPNISKKIASNNNIAYLLSVSIFIILIIVGIVWLFYRLLYGFLLKKLKRNYNELKKIDL